LQPCLLCMVLCAVAIAFIPACAVIKDSKPNVSKTGGVSMTVSDVVTVLKEHKYDPIVLKSDDGKKQVVVTPSLVGRVMCATMDGENGATNAVINTAQIKKGFSTSGYGARSTPGDGWNSFGGAERIWFAPEGGTNGLFFKPGDDQIWPNYFMSASFNSIHYKVVNASKDDKSVTFAVPVKLTNYQGKKMGLDITRTISLLEWCPFTTGLDEAINFVGFESKTVAQNTGSERLTKESSPVSLWTVGQFNCTEHTVILIPFRKGPVSELGEPVTTEYFRYFLTEPNMPETYWHIADGCVLIKANGKVQTKLEMLKRRALGYIASVDLASNTMTIVSTDVYPQMAYAASFFLPYRGDVFDGGVLSAFILKGTIGDPNTTALYELETCSPIMELQPQEKFGHRVCTYTLRGGRESLNKICKKFFNVEVQTLEQFDMQSH
jgi:hypothetical protein